MTVGVRLAKVSTTSLRHPLTRAPLVLTLTTGVIDAGGYLGLGHVFTANMTGNIVLLGFGIAGGSGLPVIAPMVSPGRKNPKELKCRHREERERRDSNPRPPA
jgi:hypothetical protein